MYPHVSLTLAGGCLGGGRKPLGEKAPIGRGQFSRLGTAVSCQQPHSQQLEGGCPGSAKEIWARIFNPVTVNLWWFPGAPLP